MKKLFKPLLAVALFMVMQLVAGLLAAAGTMLHLGQATAMSIALILCGGATVIILLNLGIVRERAFQLLRMRWALLPLAVVGAFAGIFTMNTVCEALYLPDYTRDEVLKMAYNPLGIIVITLVAPFVEEVVFREGIISPMLRHHFHRWQAILVSALAFSIVHLNPVQIPFAFVMGIIFAIIFMKTGNIFTSLAIHIANNALAILQIRLFGESTSKLKIAVDGDFQTYLVIAIGAAICIVCLSLFWNMYHRGERIQNPATARKLAELEARHRHRQHHPHRSFYQKFSEGLYDLLHPNPYNDYNKYGRYHR